MFDIPHIKFNLNFGKNPVYLVHNKLFRRDSYEIEWLNDRLKSSHIARTNRIGNTCYLFQVQKIIIDRVFFLQPNATLRNLKLVKLQRC